MKTFLTVLLGIAVLSLSVGVADAGSKKCKNGTERDEATGKCVVVRGS